MILAEHLEEGMVVTIPFPHRPDPDAVLVLKEFIGEAEHPDGLYYDWAVRPLEYPDDDRVLLSVRHGNRYDAGHGRGASNLSGDLIRHPDRSNSHVSEFPRVPHPDAGEPLLPPDVYTTKRT